MQCAKCKFNVSQEMKFALMKNICPACGTRLFSDKEMNDISLLRNRILNQPFASEFGDEVSFDLALFILDEIKNGLGQKYFQNMAIKSELPIASEESEAPDLEEDFRKKVREEIEQEYPELQSMPEESAVSTRTRAESASEKARRLREVARKAGMGNKQGAMVRRVGS